MIESYKKVVFENYANFKGRARREEFWFYSLAGLIISIVLMIIDQVSGLTFGVAKTGILGLIYGLAVFLPGFAVSVRRLHDINKSGWLSLIILIPLIGAIWLLVLFCKEGDQGRNGYGEDPKNIFDEMDEIGKE
ncbi:DUF805 domain-containing protein [Flavobacterium sp.]|uniref:DUF805 domain-containing protein n=1 Tax=Flavobacterium sp. TaxID=239 RepID=UPI00374D6BF7